MYSYFKDKNYRLVFQLLSFVIAFTIYLFTLAPTISYTDSGELALACIKLAIAHPTGYPLFTILGKVFFLFHFGEEAYILNLMCAVFSALAVLVFFNVLVLILSEIGTRFVYKYYHKKISGLTVNIISILSSFILAFSRTFWDSANSIEVWSLHNLLIVLIIYVFLQAIIYSSEKHYLLFAYILGLSFTNHLSTIFIILGFSYLYFCYEGINKISFKRFLYMTIFFILGLTVYIYLIIRANNNVITWIYPLDLYNLFYHITGKHFSGLMFKSFDSSLNMFFNFVKFFPGEYFYFPLIISAIGFVFLWKVSLKYFLFTLLLFVFNLILAINYEILDFENYYYLTPLCVAIWFAFGLLFLIGSLHLKNIIAFSIAGIIILITIFGNYNKVDESDNYIIQDYYLNFVSCVPENSVVVTEGMDVAMLASFYYQIIKGIKPTVVIFNDNLISSAPWYIKFLENHYSEFFNRSKNEFDMYLKYLLEYHYNRKKNFDRKNLVLSYIALYKNIVENNDVYFTQEFVSQYLKNSVLNDIIKDYSLVPYGLFFKITKDTNFIDDGNPDFKYQIKEKPLDKLIKEDPFYTIIVFVYYRSYLARAGYLIQYKKFEEAEKLLKNAEKLVPERTEAKQMLINLNMMKDKKK